MTFSEQKFASRFTAMGDLAEAQYQEQQPHGTCVRFGWQRPPVHMGNMTAVLRYMPDFYAQDGCLVEVMGCGRDGILKGMKVDKWSAMLVWHEHVADVRFWLWNSTLDKGISLTLIQMAVLVQRSATDLGVRSFEVDGNRYYPLPWEWIEKAVDHGQASDPSLDSSARHGSDQGGGAAAAPAKRARAAGASRRGKTATAGS